MCHQSPIFLYMTLTSACVTSLLYFFYAVQVLCVLALFICGIVTTVWFSEHKDLPLEVREAYWSSVGQSMISLLRIMTLDWWDIIVETGAHVRSSYVFLVGFLVLAGFGIMGLFAAVFVESLLNAKVPESNQNHNSNPNPNPNLDPHTAPDATFLLNTQVRVESI